MSNPRLLLVYHPHELPPLTPVEARYVLEDLLTEERVLPGQLAEKATAPVGCVALARQILVQTTRDLQAIQRGEHCLTGAFAMSSREIQELFSDIRDGTAILVWAAIAGWDGKRWLVGLRGLVSEVGQAIMEPYGET